MTQNTPSPGFSGDTPEKDHAAKAGEGKMRQSAIKIQMAYVCLLAAFILVLSLVPLFGAPNPQRGIGAFYESLLSHKLSFAGTAILIVSPLIAAATLGRIWSPENQGRRRVIFVACLVGLASTIAFFAEFVLFNQGALLYQLGGDVFQTPDSVKGSASLFCGGLLIVFLATILRMVGAETSNLTKLIGEL